MAESTWELRELALLEAIAEAERQHNDDLNTEDLEDQTDLSTEDVQWGLQALFEAEPPFITGADATTSDGFDLLAIRLRERGRRVVGQWPTEDAADVLLAMIQERADEESDPIEKTRLEKLREVAGNVGRETLTQLVVAASKQAAGL